MSNEQRTQSERSKLTPATSTTPIGTLNPDRRGFWKSIKDRLWGYDFFISYHWASGGTYAVNLAQRLREQNYDVFLDRADYASGDDWKAVGEIALRNTQRLVLIATREAVTISKPVEHEITIFTARNRQVIPIVFGDKFEDLDRSQYLTLNRMPDSKLYIEEGKETLVSGPSDKIVAELIRTQGVMRRRNLRALLSLIPAVAVIAFASFAGISWINALSSAEKAETERQTAVGERNIADIERDNARQSLAKASRESANVYWQLALNARDQDHDGIKAAQFFLRGAEAIFRIPEGVSSNSDRSHGHNLSFAAHAAVLPLQQSLVHDGPVQGSLFNEDHSRVLTWSDDKTAKLWDVTKGELLQTFQHDAGVTGALFGGDESSIVTWCGDTANLWDVAKAKLLQRYSQSGFSIYGAILDGSGTRILTWADGKSDNRGRATLWNVSDGKQIQSFHYEDAIVGARFSRDESGVFTWGGREFVWRGEAKLWDVATGEPIRTFRHEDVVRSALFGLNESRVLTWSVRDAARIWDLNKNEPIHSFQQYEVRGAVSSRNGSLWIIWGDNNVKLWDVATNKPVHTLNAAGGAVFSPNESRVLTLNGKESKLWDVATGRLLKTFSHASPVRDACFSQDESRILFWGGDSLHNRGEANLCDVVTGQPILTLGQDADVSGATFSKDGSRFVMWSRNDTAVKLWDLRRVEPIQTFKHDLGVINAKFSPDESRIVTTSILNSVKSWDAGNGLPIEAPHPEIEVVGAATGGDATRAFSPDNSLVLVWGMDKAAELRDVRTERPIHTFHHENFRVSGGVFNGDGSLLLTWDDDTSAKLWHAKNGESLRNFHHQRKINGAVFFRHTSRVLTWSDDYTAKLWELNSAEPIQTFSHGDAVLGAILSQNESRILTWGGRYDAKCVEAKLWEVSKAEPLHILKHGSWVYGAVFNREESRVLTWSAQGAAKLWDISLPFQGLTPTERILELEVRSGTTLDASQKMRALSFAEWQAKARSAEYQTIVKKVAARSEKIVP